MTVNLFWIAAVGIVAAMAGFWTGRLSILSVMDSKEEQDGDNYQEEQRYMEAMTERKAMAERKAIAERMSVTEKRIMEAEESAGVKQVSEGQSGKGSLAAENRKAGIILKAKGMYRNSGKRARTGEKRISLGWAIGSPASGEVSTFFEGSRRGAVIRACEGVLYAPASGKITRLYPLGNQMILRTDSGVELLIRVGSHADELCSMYYRPRVVQNEIVNKGKLLLEYDVEGLRKEGVDTEVSISVEAAEDFRDIIVTEKGLVKAGEELLWVRERPAYLEPHSQGHLL